MHVFSTSGEHYNESALCLNTPGEALTTPEA